MLRRSPAPCAGSFRHASRDASPMSTLVVSGTGTGVGKTVVTAAMAALAAARGARRRGGQARRRPAWRRARTATSTSSGGWPGSPTCTSTPGSPTRSRRPPRPDAPSRPPVDLPRRGGAGARADAGRAASSWSRAPAGCWSGTTRRAPRSPTSRTPCGAPVLVVTEPGLGTLNHTALTLEAMAHRGLELAGVVHRVVAGRARPRLPQQRPRPRDAGRATARRRDARRAPARWTRAEFLLAARAGLGPALGGTFDAADFRR